MRYLSKTISSLALFCCATHVFAANPVCPPVNMIVENANFTQATLVMPDTNMWAMASTPFVYADKSWNVIMGVTLPHASNEAEALEQGKAFFQNYSVLAEGNATEIGSHAACIYTSIDNQATYIIGATTPPYAFPALARQLIAR